MTRAVVSAEPAHSELGASSSSRWMNCPGSVALCRKAPPRKDTIYSREGTIAHELASYCLSNGLYDAKDGIDSVPSLAELYTMFPGQGAEKTAEMVDGVNVFLNTVYDAMQVSGEETAALFVETRFRLSGVAPGMFGTADAVVARVVNRTMHVFDFKYGAGQQVEAVDNSQGAYYALGAMQTLDHLKPREIEIVIVQPRGRGDAVKRWRIDAVDLVEFKITLREKAEATTKPDAPLKKGSWCYFCDAKLECPLMLERALEIAQNDFAPKEAQPAQITPDRMAELLELSRYVDYWVSAVRDYCREEADAGRPPTGYGLKRMRDGASGWLAGVKASDVLALVQTNQPIEGLLPPPAVREIVGKEQFEKLKALYIQKPDVMALKKIEGAKKAKRA